MLDHGGLELDIRHEQVSYWTALLEAQVGQTGRLGG